MHDEVEDDEALLDRAFERLLHAIENGEPCSATDLAVQRPDLQPQIAELERLAQACAAQRPLELPRIAGYAVERELGRGAMGVVYLARHLALDRLVALKLSPLANADPRARQRFLAEARAMARVHHPHVIPIHDVVEESTHCAFAMEFVDGRSLAQVLAECAGLPIAERLSRIEAHAGVALSGDHGWAGFVVRIGAEIAEALAAVHATGLTHRDVKPSNVIVRNDGCAFLADFGLVHDEDAELTRTGQFLGTLHYAAPEQIAGRSAEVGPQSDVYALGVTLYHALALQPPYAERSTPHMLARIESGAFPRLRRVERSISRDLELVVAKAMDPQRAHRYASAAEMAEDLRRVLAFEPVAARQLTTVVRLRRWVRRHPSFSTALVVSALLLGIAAVVLDRERSAAARAARVPTDELLLAGLLSELTQLLPGREPKIEALESWLREAGALLHRFEEYERDADAPSAAESSAPLPATADPERERVLRMRAALEGAVWEDRWVREWVRALERRWNGGVRTENRGFDPESSATSAPKAQLQRLVSQGSSLRQAVEIVEQRLERERRAAVAWRSALEEAWPATRRWLAEAPGREMYAGLDLEPQAGLVPLGPDPRSGLLEFAHLASGALPRRDAAGDLEVDPTTGIVLVLVPGGEFTMGTRRAAPGEKDGFDYCDDSATVHERPLTSLALAPFFLAKWEMTQAQWQRLTNENPSWYAIGAEIDSRIVTERHPVESITWDEARKVVEGVGLTLPTDAQWERAVRAGTSTKYWTGADPYALEECGNLADAGSYVRSGVPPEQIDAKVQKGDVLPWDDGWLRHAPVGIFRPNPFGFHDMLGNVSEYCLELSPPKTPMLSFPAQAGDGRRETGRDAWEAVLRGAAYHSAGYQARSSFRLGVVPSMRSPSVGVRPARRLDG